MPPQRPDLNLIENLWSVLKTSLNNYTIRNIPDLKRALRKEWEKITSKLTKKLVKSMSRRLYLYAVLKQRGYPTKY